MHVSKREYDAVMVSAPLLLKSPGDSNLDTESNHLRSLSLKNGDKEPNLL